MMENKQTAVEFLIYLFSETIDEEFYKKEIEVAKQMEKEQIIDAVEWNYKSNMGEVYYKATYGK
jgi:hypothetical protein